MTINPATAYLYGTMLQRRNMFDAQAAVGRHDISICESPQENCRVVGQTENSSAAALRRILTGSVFPLRYEPDNLVSIHRGVASSSGAFAIDLIVVDPVRGSAFVVDSPNFCLAAIAWTATAVPDLHAAPLLYLVARLDRLIARYGDLAFSLAAYEAGMIAGQIRLLAWEEGWEFQYHSARGDQYLRAATGIDAWQWVPLIAGRLAGATARSAIPVSCDAPTVPQLVQPAVDDAVRAPLTRALLAQPSAPQAHDIGDPILRYSLNWLDLHQAIAARTSDAQRQHGHVMPCCSMEECDRLLKRTAALLPVMQSFSARQKSVALLVIADGTDGPFGGRLELSLGQSWSPLDSDSLDTIHSLLKSEGGCGFACYLAIDEREHPITDCATLVNEWLWTGVVTQALCLAASSIGWFARPVRNFDDARANSIARPFERVVMKVELGKLATSPFSFTLART